MFSLADSDLASAILGCADGPASFNAQATEQGVRVTSVDPIYALSTAQIRERIAATSNDVIEQTRQNQQEFLWTSIASPEELLEIRMRAMELFLTDYEIGKAEGRYVTGSLPSLPFEDASFDLAVCSHFLFLYSEQLGADFHLSAIHELCRVAKEVRIFPLLGLGAIRSAHVSRIASSFRQRGFSVSIDRVPYEFQRGANEMMRISDGPSQR
ncbi:MAG TPA: class I SAM-dependent methyltransferase [Gemmatimonadaceae bacterium]|nr:class I SAM-dependent methyltransferase [Gemmatimonadaceae bacterium]